MKMMKGRFLRAFLYKWRKVSNEVSASINEKTCWWAQWPCFNGNDEPIPRDVPKGHLVVYVGKDYKRFVIRVSFLHHPLFKALLERAREEYQFNPDRRLCIPCDEKTFLNVVRCVSNQQEGRVWIRL